MSALDWWRRFLRDLVATPSVTGDTEKAVSFFTESLKEKGFDAYRDEAGNAVAVAGAGDRDVLLVGHIDTVEGDLPVRVTDDGFLTGRGSVDAKGPLAAFARAAERFLDDDRVRVVVVGACDEEGESDGARHLLPRYRPEALVIGEPSGTDGVTIGYKGIVKIRYVVEEDLQHTGAPFPTVADRGMAFWSAVQAFLAHDVASVIAGGGGPASRRGRAPPHGGSLFDTPTVKLTSFNTNILPNGRDRAELVGSARIPPGFDSDGLLEFLAARAGVGTLDVPEVAPAHLADKNSLLSRAFVASVREAGLRPRFVKKTGTSDMNLLAPAWGCPVVAYGPGDASLDHTPQERVALADYDRAAGVLERAIERVAAGAL